MDTPITPVEPPRLGVFPHEPPEIYYARRLDVANNTGLKIIDTESPAHYRFWVTNPEADDEGETAALRFGKAYHMATLEPDVFRAVYSVLPQDAPRDMRRFRDAKKPSDETLASIDWWDAWEDENAGRVMLTRTDYDLAVAMAASQRRLELKFGMVRITLAELIDECLKEVTVYWIDEDTGILCKLRADMWSEDLCFAGDLKSAMCASREAFSQAIHRHRYHVQHAHYSEGFRAAGFPLKSFGLLPVEKKAPHVPASWHVGPVSEERGWAIRQRSMRKLAACLKSDRWPGYTDTMTPIEIPAYGHYDSEDNKA